MTAPLYFPKKGKENRSSLAIATNRFLDAVDNNETTNIEKHMIEILDHEVSQDCLHMLYRYADAHQCNFATKYLEEILATTCNMCNFTRIKKERK